MIALFIFGSLVVCGKRRRSTEEIADEVASDTWGPLKNGSLFIVVDDLDDDALIYFLDYELPQLEPGAPINSIAIYGERLSERSLRRLFALNRMGKVTNLFLAVDGLGATEIDLIASQPWAPNLEYLSEQRSVASVSYQFTFCDSALDARGARALGRLVKGNPNLPTIKLMFQRFRAQALDALCTSDRTALDISGGRFAGNQVARFLECSPMRELRCKTCDIGPGELATLETVSPTLEVLDLEQSAIFDVDIEALGAADAHLRELRIDSAPCLSDRALIAVSTSTWFHELEHVTISGYFSKPEVERFELAWFPRQPNALTIDSFTGRPHDICQRRVDREARIAHTIPE